MLMLRTSSKGSISIPVLRARERAAIDSLVTDFADVYPLTYEEWEDGFRRDRTYPPGKLLAGFTPAAILKVMRERFRFSPAEKKECFRVLAACLTGARDTVRDRCDVKLLSHEQVSMAVKYAL